VLPDILICTQVGQEGIDLHRHCRHVVHYDLGWNSASIEQSTGRVDRIGSKTTRERKIAVEVNEGDQETSAAHKEQIAASDVRSPSQIFTSESGALAFWFDQRGISISVRPDPSAQ
jgi:superfamily II DNA/RNA helicase